VAPTAPSSGPLLIDQASAWPNPNPQAVLAFLEGPADSIVLKVYTTAWIQVGSSQAGPFNAGWARIPMPVDLKELPRGLYYFSVQAQLGGRRSPVKAGRFYLWR
jgi:hypothetical protein